jgi:hypothetical protein
MSKSSHLVRLEFDAVVRYRWATDFLNSQTSSRAYWKVHGEARAQISLYIGLKTDEEIHLGLPEPQYTRHYAHRDRLSNPGGVATYAFGLVYL